MVEDEIPSKTSLQNLVDNLDRTELNAESQRWALAHGKCVHLSIELFSYFYLI